MLFVAIALLTVGMMLILADGRNEKARWLSAVAFSGASGALAVVTNEVLRPPTVQWLDTLLLDRLLHTASIVFSLGCYYGMPYAYVLFALVFRNDMPLYRYKRTAMALLALPIGAMLLFDPIHPIPYSAVIWWVVPYIVAGTALLLYRRPRGAELSTPYQRTALLLTHLAVIVPVWFCLLMNYVLPLFGVFEMWRYNVWIIAYAFFLFLYAIFNFGFLGVRLLIERKKLGDTMRAVTSGTALLHHAIKNDIGKMKLFGDKISKYAQQTGQTELAEDIRVVMSASQHIQDMLNRVQDQTQHMVLRLDTHSLRELLEDALRPFGLRSAAVEAVLEPMAEDVLLYCDRAQLLEVLANVLNNAAEAMPGGGRVQVAVAADQRKVSIAISDNGSGMSREQRSRALEPFYTTKVGSRTNFGLGLAYCYNVMRRHGGKIELFSEPGKGTTVRLQLPRRTAPKGGK